MVCEIQGELMRREEILLSESIKRTLDQAHTAHVRLHEVQESNTLDSLDDPTDHEDGDAKDLLSYLIEKLYLDTSLLAERLGAPQFAALINLERCAASVDFAKNEYTHHDGLPHLPHLARVKMHFSALRVMTEVASTTAHDVLRTILQNTGKLISQRGLRPSSEAQVRNAMLEVIRLGFEDAYKEVPIRKRFKTYKADIGIPSLRAVIEYKYVKSSDEMKACLDGIYADMKGYSGEDSWRIFYAVFYMTEPFFRQDEVEKEFALVTAELNWIPVVVSGPSSRKFPV
jgi:hypothetical protein